MNKLLVFISLIVLSLVLIVYGGQYDKTNVSKQDDYIEQTDIENTIEKVVLSEDTTQKYKIAVAHEDKTYEVISSEKTYDEALYKVTNVDNDNLIIVNGPYIVYVKYGYLDLKTKPVTENTLFYVDGKRNYVNGHYGIDALFINTENRQYEMMISNERGLIDSNDVEIVPMAYAKSPSHYIVNGNDELVHAISTDLYQKDSYTYSGPIDKAPDYLKQGKIYYSYDGIYFYTSLQALIDDVRRNTHENAINGNKPYYNYYQYLSLRNKTNYTATELNRYIENTLDSYGYTDSILYNTGHYFINGQNQYEVNAAIELAWAMHESLYGTSNLAKNKYNLFGLNARDENPYADAFAYSSLQESINTHMNQYVNLKYLDGTDNVLGNKGLGINDFYASDPYWGEKIASAYYRLDKYLGFKDYQSYDLDLIYI